MKFRITLEIPEQDLLWLASHATTRGYARVEPRRSWTDREMKDAVRFLSQRLLEVQLKKI